jgi:CheY-like chemotaxis protein
VLLVEDNEINRQVAEAMLTALGCEVVVVENGREAVERLARQPDGPGPGFDLVFMDCQLPEMDGFEATRAIREAEADAGRARVPIVALTAHAMRHDRDQCLRAGMDDYVPKPFEREDLARQIERWAPQRSVHRRERFPADTGAPAPGPLEPAALRGLRTLEEQSGPDLVAGVVDVYLESSAALERELREAAAEGAPQRLARAAHKLKSSSAQLGAQRLASLCKELEALGRAGTCEGASGIVTRLQAELEQVREALAAESYGAPAGGASGTLDG